MPRRLRDVNSAPWGIKEGIPLEIAKLANVSVAFVLANTGSLRWHYHPESTFPRCYVSHASVLVRFPFWFSVFKMKHVYVSMRALATIATVSCRMWFYSGALLFRPNTLAFLTRASSLLPLCNVMIWLFPCRVTILASSLWTFTMSSLSAEPPSSSSSCRTLPGEGSQVHFFSIHLHYIFFKTIQTISNN